MAVARYYDADKNPDGAQGIPGVPLADITEARFARLPKWAQASVDASGLYRKTKPSEAKAAAPAKAAPKKKAAAAARPKAAAVVTPAPAPAPAPEQPTLAGAGEEIVTNG
jgi:hypothetical protein